MIAWLMRVFRRPAPARPSSGHDRIHEEYAEMRIRLARELRECDERRLSYDRRTMHRPHE